MTKTASDQSFSTGTNYETGHV